MFNGHFPVAFLWSSHKIPYEKPSFLYGFPMISQKIPKLSYGKSHEIPLNHHFPMVSLWFSYGFPTKKPPFNHHFPI